MRRVLIIVAIILLPAIPIILLVTGVIKKKPTTVATVQLAMWGTEDTSTTFNSLITAYRINHPYVKVVYTKVRPEDYEQQLVNGWAQGQGPDIFFVPHAWIGRMKPFAAAFPATAIVPEVRTNKSFIGASQKIVNVTQTAPTLISLQDAFVDAVVNDVYLGGQTWGLPLSLDTVAVYYNKDLLNNAKIFEPAKTWGELVSQMSGLTVIDEHGGIVQSAVALGTANNVPYATDLLTLLMMQNGATMTTSGGQVRFREAPGLTALNFYTSFAQAKKTSYSWNADLPNARDAFLQGKVAYYFGTLNDRAAIAKGNLNWGVASMFHLSPQGDNDASGRVRFIDTVQYNVGMVSKASQLRAKSKFAWNFLVYITNSSQVTSYLNTTARLSARKKILATQKDDPIKGLFANQLLTARSWYHGNDGPAVDGYLSALITSVLEGKTDAQQALNLAAEQVQSTL